LYGARLRKEEVVSESTDKVALVSGGSRGIGEGIVADLLHRGFRVAAFSRTSTPFVERCVASNETRDVFWWASVDAEDSHAVRAFVASAAARFGPADVLVNNAALPEVSLLVVNRPADARRVMAVNLESALAMIHACAPAMVEHRRGCIVNVTSVVGSRGVRGLALYSATKAALDGVTRTLAVELGPSGVRVNSVAPGYIETDMTSDTAQGHRDQIMHRTPLGRYGRVGDVVAAVRYLTSPDAAFVTGHTLVVDGGYTA
jgi:3-oxoacyl-[acyl-carrier protein] reductase